MPRKGTSLLTLLDDIEEHLTAIISSAKPLCTPDADRVIVAMLQEISLKADMIYSKCKRARRIYDLLYKNIFIVRENGEISSASSSEKVKIINAELDRMKEIGEPGDRHTKTYAK